MTEILHTLWSDQDGIVTVEYALLLSLIVIAVIPAFAYLGQAVANIGDAASKAIDLASTTHPAG